MEFHRFGNVAEVCNEPDFRSFGGHGKPDWIDGVVGDGEGIDVEIPDADSLAGAERRDPGTEIAPVMLVPRDAGSGKAAHEDGDVEFLDEGEQSGDMIRMLVRDKHGVERFRAFTDRFQSRNDFAAAHTRVDQNASL